MTSSPTPPLDPADHGRRRGLYVIGMHRSGTSAVTGVVAALGLTGPAEHDRMPTAEWNERGNYESRSLTACNRRVLRALGGEWSTPPILVPGWESDPALAGLRAEARATLGRAFATDQFVWKDPRNCLLLPFWKVAAGPLAATVFVYRDPTEVARSMEARSNLSPRLGLALWERYVRSAAAGLAGLPTYAISFERVLAEPEAWSQELADFLEGVGIQVDRRELTGSAETVDAGLRHQRSPAERADAAGHRTGDQADLLAALDAAQGPHQQWSAPDLGDEPPWVEAHFAERRRRLAAESDRPKWQRPLARVRRRFTRTAQGGASTQR